jgi:uncharacterized membrane protein
MATISQVKTLGGVGSILVLLTPAPSVGWILGIAGFILILFAVKQISDIFNDSSIFNNMLIAILLAIVGVIVGGLVVVGSFFRFIGQNNLAGPDYFGQNFNASTIPVGDWAALITTVLAGLAVIWVLFLVSAIFIRRSYSSIATRLSVHMFATAGLLYLIGAATTIVLVGFLLILVSQILLAIAFFSINERTIEVGVSRR